MGGLARKLPVTWVVMLFGALALGRHPAFLRLLLQGRDPGRRLRRAHSASAFMAGSAASSPPGSPPSTSRGCSCSPSTASRARPKHVQEHVHESPLVMLAAAGGPAGCRRACSAVFCSATASSARGFAAFWGASIAGAGQRRHGRCSTSIPAWAALAPLVAAIIGIAVAVLFYVLVSRAARDALAALLAGSICSCSTNGILTSSTTRCWSSPALRLAKFAWHFGDEQVIDGVPSGLATLTSDASTQAVKLQTGSIALYAFIMLIGLLGLPQPLPLGALR